MYFFSLRNLTFFFLKKNSHSVRQALQQTIPYVITSYPQNTPQTVVRGSSAGILVGGNLSLLAAMLGAKVPLFPSPDVPIILVVSFFCFSLIFMLFD